MSELKEQRAAIYSLIASLYLNGALRADKDGVVSLLESIASAPFTNEAGEAADMMAKALNGDGEGVFDEFEALFNLPFGDFLPSSVSYYYDQREFGEFTIAAKEIMHEAGYIKDDSFCLGEDEFGYLAAISAKLLKEGKEELQKKLFKNVFSPHIAGFIDAQLKSERASFYKNAATFLALFVAFEREWLAANL